MPLAADTLAFQCCGVPVVYHRHASASEIEIEFASGERRTFPGDRIDADLTRRICGRTGDVDRIHVRIGTGASQG